MNFRQRSTKSVHILFVLTAGLGTASALAASTASKTNPAQNKTEIKEPSRFGLMANVQTSSNFKPVNSSEHTAETALLVVPTYKVGDNYSLGVRAGLTKDMEDERTLKVEDTRISFSRPGLDVNPFLKLTPEVAAIAPTSIESRDTDSLVMGASVRGKLMADLTRFNLSKLEPYYRLTLTRNFHTYEVSYEGKSNTMASVGNLLGADYTFTDHFKISGLASRSTGFTYNGSPKNNFEFQESVSYSPSAAVEIAIGHNNSGTAFRENGRDSNVAFFDESKSVFFLSVTVTQ